MSMTVLVTALMAVSKEEIMEGTMKSTVLIAVHKMKDTVEKPKDITDELFLEVARLYKDRYGDLPTSWKTYMQDKINTNKGESNE